MRWLVPRTWQRWKKIVILRILLRKERELSKRKCYLSRKCLCAADQRAIAAQSFGFRMITSYLKLVERNRIKAKKWENWIKGNCRNNAFGSIYRIGQLIPFYKRKLSCLKISNDALLQQFQAFFRSYISDNFEHNKYHSLMERIRLISFSNHCLSAMP